MSTYCIICKLRAKTLFLLEESLPIYNDSPLHLDINLQILKKASQKLFKIETVNAELADRHQNTHKTSIIIDPLSVVGIKRKNSSKHIKGATISLPAKCHLNGVSLAAG